MPLWTFGSVEDEPQVQLVHWRVLEATYADAGEPSTRHFVGADAIDKTGRVGSAIQSIDLASRKGVTRSGRVYELVGAPGRDAEGEYVWGRWCRINLVATWVDVTAEVVQERKDKNCCDVGSVGKSGTRAP